MPCHIVQQPCSEESKNMDPCDWWSMPVASQRQTCESSLILTYPDLFDTRDKILHYLQCVKPCNIKTWENSPTNWYRILLAKGTVLINWSFRIWFVSVQFPIPFRLLNSEHLFHCAKHELAWLSRRKDRPFMEQDGDSFRKAGSHFFHSDTLPETDMAPENGWLEY